MALRNQATTARPRFLLPSNNSAFAGKVTFRGSIAGMITGSIVAMWLLTKIAPPLAGTFSAPWIRARNPNRTSGRKMKILKNLYHMGRSQDTRRAPW